MEFNNSKLRGKIRELFGTEQKFSDAIGISKSALSAKLNNNSEINRDEMLKMIDLLNIKKEDIFEIFFLTFQFVFYEKRWVLKTSKKMLVGTRK